MEPLDYITLAPQETAKLLSAGSGDAALVYLYMRATGDMRLQRAGEQLRLSAETLSWAEALLKRLGLMDVSQTAPRYQSENAPRYTAEAVSAYSAKDPSFQLLQGEISRRLGRVLTSEDLKTLLAIRDYLKMPPEVVSMVLTYCLQKNEYYNSVHGGNRTVTMRAIEKECYAWANQGIVTLESASDYINRSLLRLRPENQIARLLQLDRPLVDSEKRYIDTWLSMGFPPEVIRLAYEKTVMATGKLTWRYLDKILLRWHEKNLHTLQEVQGEQKPVQSDPRAAEYTLGESELSAIANLQKLRDSLKGSDD